MPQKLIPETSLCLIYTIYIHLDKAILMSHNVFRNIRVAKKGAKNMSKKGSETKRLIKEQAYKLFAIRGFKDVTMKDICEITGLSRGGLYRHYDSTDQIFSEII